MTKKNEKKLIKKEEKYIHEIVTSAGSHLLKIEIRKYDQTFRKNVRIEDFDTPGQALSFAVKLRDETLTKMSQGYTVSQFPTVGEIYEKTFTVLSPLRVKTKYRHDIFFRNGIGDLALSPIDRISSAQIQETLNIYGKTHTSRQTQGLLAVWRRIYKAAAMMNINVIDRTVAVSIPECMEDDPRPKSISPEDLETFCDVLKDYNKTSVIGSYRSHAIFFAVMIMRYTGMRPAEVFALTKNDIDLVKGFITINKAVRSTSDTLVDIGRAKTEKSKRVIPIPDDLRPFLHECLAWSKHDFLLADFHGNLFQIDEITQTVNHVAKRAKVRFNLYMLRHQFSTDLFNTGINPTVIRDLMGHESATMSLDYAVSNEKDRVQAVNKRKFS